MDDLLREILGFFAMMLGTLMDPIATLGYIASGLFIRKFSGALAASIGWNIVLRIVIAALQNGNADAEQPDAEVVVSSFVGAVFVTAIIYFFASKRRKEVQIEAANKKQKDDAKPDA
jgi:ABC-type Fe3+-siderophore transport system permease subunit